jgi:beta-lactamase regulating signal transducer with metallopeptidase domain
MIVALATALLHFVWQGLVLGLAVWILRPALRRAEASIRYGLLFGLLALAPLLVTSTFLLALGSSSGPHTSVLAMPSSPRWAQVVTSVWGAGVGMLALRSAFELVHLLRLRATGLPLRAWHATLESLRACLGVRGHVTLAESPAVVVPLVTGWLRPMILLPLGLVARMPASWIEAVLAHELAHVRRHDVLLGIVQRAIEVLLFFHPVVWWISSEIRHAREEACDDLVVDVLQSPLEYARALTELAASNAITPALAMGLEKGSLMSRIRHIIDRSPRPLRTPRRLPAVGVALALGIVTGIGCLTQLDPNDDPATAERADATEAAQRALEIEITAEERLGISQGLSIAWLPEQVAGFETEIVTAAQRHGVDPDLLAIVVLVESRGDPQARSPIGARGLMQVMPQTAAAIAAERGLEHSDDELDDPTYNLDLGAWYLARQLEEFGTDRPTEEAIDLAAAAYNAGPNRVRKALRGEAELSDETQRYRSIVAALWSERQLPESSLMTD